MMDARRRGYLAAALVVLLASLALGPHLVGADARHLSAYRDGDQDASRFLEQVVTDDRDVRAIVSTVHLLGEVDRPEQTLLIILGIERRYDASEARAVLDFLKAGGNVLLADEKGFGSDISHAAGFAFGAQRVLDTRNHLGDEKLVVSDVRLGAETYRVLFNAPSNLIPLSGSERSPHEVLARSSSAAYPHGSYLDVNGDGVIDIADQAGPFPLVVRAQVGDGTLVMVSDTGVFMNRELGIPEYDNADFLRALVNSLVPAGGHVLVDEARHAPPASLAMWDNAARTMGRMLLGPWGIGFVVALLAIALVVWRYTRQTEDWSHHGFDLGHENPVPDNIRPDAARAQRFAQHRISERFNIPMEQVRAMSAEALLAATSDRGLAEVASGTTKADPLSFFESMSPQEAPA